METDSSNIKYSARRFLCGIFSFVFIISFITFPKERTNTITNPLQKESRPYKADIISNLSRKYSPRPHSLRRERIYNTIINEAAKKYGIEAALIKAIIMAESGYNYKAISKSGAIGLMQLMPETADALGVEDIFDPAHNVQGGTKYIRLLLDRFDGNLELALAAYNAGSTKVRKYNGIPPFRATKIYIKKVFEYYWRYQLASQV